MRPGPRGPAALVIRQVCVPCFKDGKNMRAKDALGNQGG